MKISLEDCSLVHRMIITFSNLIRDLPEQRLVSVLFDEIRLTSPLRYTGGHVMAHEADSPDEIDKIATSAYMVEIICHHGGPNYIFRIHPSAKLNKTQLKKMLLEAVKLITTQKWYRYISNFRSLLYQSC